ncbi:hypothetical protein FHR90_000307 [Endobacter medicaginis]|uniref:Uncharacterized protein n=1 Tax=Endobacter medicaginis TaxID=1181271 RepID=A0A839UYY5_9PROT|nr:hypothetical protein [Endobacter medicaginis]
MAVSTEAEKTRVRWPFQAHAPSPARTAEWVWNGQMT